MLKPVYIRIYLKYVVYSPYVSGVAAEYRRAVEYMSQVSELNYLSQIVIMVYEDKTKPPDSADRFHVELYFSPGNYSVAVERPTELLAAGERAASGAGAPALAASMSAEDTPPLHLAHNVRPIYEQAIIESDQLEEPSPSGALAAQQQQQHAESESESPPQTASSETCERPAWRVSDAALIPMSPQHAPLLRQSSSKISSSLPEQPACAEYLQRSPVSSPPPESHRTGHRRCGHAYTLSDPKRCNLLPPCTSSIS